MKTKGILLAAALLTAVSVQAADARFERRTATDMLFPQQELTVDLYGSYLNPERGIDHIFDTSVRRGVWGGGVGANYFVSPYLGFGGDFNMHDNRGEFVDNAFASMFVRFPIQQIGLAPYLFGGGGRGFDAGEWLGHAGVGLELRLQRHHGLFIDSRYIWADKTVDQLQFRAGVRLAF